MFVNLTQISTNNPMWVDINTCFFYYFSQVGIHVPKRNKCPYVYNKLF